MRRQGSQRRVVKVSFVHEITLRGTPANSNVEAPAWMGRAPLATAATTRARCLLLLAACVAARLCVAGASDEAVSSSSSSSASSGPPPSPTDASVEDGDGPVVRTVASLGILAFAFAVLCGCWMRRRGDSDEMERRRAERERHLDGALGEHLHLGQRDARRLARRELERQELERAEAAAAAAAARGEGRGGSLEMSEIGGAGASASPTQVRVVDMPSEDERSPRAGEIVEIDEDDRAPLFGSTKRRQKSM